MQTNKESFLIILENHKGIIYKIVNSYCKEEAARQDLSQEIIIQLWLSFKNYNQQFKLSTWIYRIALNTAISFYRKSNKHKTVALSPIINIAVPSDERMNHEEDLILLQKYIQELKEIDKALILLFLEGLAQKEISEIMGITQTNASTRISRIKLKLKQKFKNHKNARNER